MNQEEDLRNVKKPTANGMTMSGSPTQHIPKPVMNAVAGSLLPPTSMFAPGMKLTMANIAPMNVVNKPGHPQKSAVTAVRIIAVVRFIVISLLNDFEPRIARKKVVVGEIRS